jgi:hypothetical protein
MDKALIVVVKSFTTLALVVGAVLVVLGASGSLRIGDSVTYTSSNPVALFVCGGALIVLAAAAYFMERRASADRTPIPDPADFGIKIIRPSNDVSVGMRTDVFGSIDKPVPKGYRLQIIRRRETTPEGYFPEKIAEVDPTGLHWAANGCWVGGNTGDGRILEAVLVGPDGALLFDTWRRSEQAFAEQTPGQGGRALSPAIKGFPADTVSCARVRVVQK